MNMKNGSNPKKTDPFAVLASLDLSAGSTRKTNGVSPYPDALLKLYCTSTYGKRTGKAMGNKRDINVTVRVADFFRKHPGDVVNIFELMRATGLGKTQVQYAINRIDERAGMEVEVIIRGQLYRWTPAEQAVNVKLVEVAPEKTDEDDVLTFWYIGQTKDERTIIRETDGDQRLYKIEEI